MVSQLLNTPRQKFDILYSTFSITCHQLMPSGQLLLKYFVQHYQDYPLMLRDQRLPALHVRVKLLIEISHFTDISTLSIATIQVKK